MAGTSSPSAERAIPAGLEAYYTRYYRDALGIPGWRALVDVRLDDAAYEGRRVARLQEALGSPLAGLRLVNVGCGTAGFNAAAVRAGALVWGVDADPEAVALAGQREGGGRVLAAAAESLPFRSEAFDVAYCFSTLEHVADARHALAEMVRVLRRGGRLYLHTPDRRGCFETHYKVVWPPALPHWGRRAFLAARGRPTAFLDTLRLLSARECRELVGAAGATVVRVLAGDDERRVGGSLWPAIRAYYRTFRIHPYVELVAERR